MLLNELFQHCDRFGVRLGAFALGPHLGEESAVHLLRDQLAVGVKTVGVSIRDHLGFGMAGVALYSLDVAPAQLQLEGGAAVPETVEHHGPQIVFLDQLIEHPVDIPGIIGPSVEL